MHLHGKTLERYLTRRLPDVELVTLDEHVSNCIFCADALATDGASSDRWECRGWLGRLVRVDVEPTVGDGLGEHLERAA